MKKYFVFCPVFFMFFLISPDRGLSGAEKSGDECRITDADTEGKDRRFLLVSTEMTPPAAFSDIGCGFVWRKTLCAMETVRFDGSSKVFDYNSGEDIPVDKAFYVRTSAIETPFGFGIIAFSSKESAEAFVSENGGTVMDYDKTKD